MPALFPVDNTLGMLFIGTVLSSIIYGVTWLQVYSYFNSHSSQDRWPLKSFVTFMTLVDTVNLVFCIYLTYRFGVTNFGDYRFTGSHPWSQPAIIFSYLVLEVSVQHFYVYRIYHLGGGSPYLPAGISVVSLTEFSLGIVYTAEIVKHTHNSNPNDFEACLLLEFYFASLSCKVLGAVLITVGMVYHLLSNRTQVRRTNNVLNLLAVYSINCGTLDLVFSVICLALFAKYRNTLIYIPSLFIVFRLNFCGFMAILNSRDHLRKTLNGPGVVATFTQLKVQPGTTVPWGVQETTGASTNAAVPKRLPPALVALDKSLSESVIAFDKERYPVPPVIDSD
ncbi:hypothetical protein H4582DRAFT_2074738 [Lactarius indigo]|nr:hypothetical protein H4582DRAFT_2074738 [Lactarius indigo]